MQFAERLTPPPVPRSIGVRKWETAMRILVTNDDGILAPGILALRRAVADMGEVTVVAPVAPQSAVGHSITLTDPIRVHRVPLGDGVIGCGVQGRPADCVKLAILELMPERPDLVVSGVNLGANTGINVLYSGTVAAAVEGAFFGVPAVAVSIGIPTPPISTAPPASPAASSTSFSPKARASRCSSTSTCRTSPRGRPRASRSARRA
jgi:5'/3'-nucleotidase SurE